MPARRTMSSEPPRDTPAGVVGAAEAMRGANERAIRVAEGRDAVREMVTVKQALGETAALHGSLEKASERVGVSTTREPG